MRDEVEEFLKRVAQMRAQAEAQAKSRQQRPQPQQPPQPPPQPSPPRLVPARQESAPLQSAAAEVVDAELADSDDGVARHVTQYLRGTEQIAEHTRHLGEKVDAADKQMEAHLHQVFDHQLGHLKMTATDSSAVAASDVKRTGFTAGTIVDMLLSQDNIRTAVILGEILRRPEE